MGGYISAMVSFSVQQNLPPLRIFQAEYFCMRKFPYLSVIFQELSSTKVFAVFFAVSDKLLVLILWVPIFILKILRQGNLHELMSI